MNSLNKMEMMEIRSAFDFYIHGVKEELGFAQDEQEIKTHKVVIQNIELLWKMVERRMADMREEKPCEYCGHNPEAIYCDRCGRKL